MKKNKVIITAASICLLFSAAGFTAYADESAPSDTAASVKSPDTGGDKGITAAVAGAVISAAAIVLSYRKRKS